MYDIMTYTEGQPQFWYSLDKFGGAVYFSEWLIKLHIVQHRIQYLITVNAFVDLVTAVPLFFSSTDEDQNIIVQVVRIIRIVRVVRMINKYAAGQGSTEVTRQLVTILLTIITMIFVTAGVVLEIENNNVSPEEQWDFDDMIYFVIVTISTVAMATSRLWLMKAEPL